MATEEELLDDEIVVKDCFTCQDETLLVIDSGATRSIGSASALEAIAMAIGADRISVDTSRRPRFRFGNGERGVASSTVTLRLSDSTEEDLLEFAVIETEAFVPVLLSIAWLREHHAVIDFYAGTMSTTRGPVNTVRSTDSRGWPQAIWP